MAKTGLIDRLVDSSKQIDAGRKGLNTPGKANKGQATCFDGIAQAISALKEAQATKDPKVIWTLEYVYLVQERQFCDLEEKLALMGYDKMLIKAGDALRSLEVVNSAPDYVTAEKTHPTTGTAHRVNGLPKDAFHSSCNYNISCLEHTITSAMSKNERELTKQRAENLKTAKSEYEKLQTKALGLTETKTK
ncbi:hypothetical protein RsTz2092_04850 [Deferribacterales bacterium RsTz2092]|nr:hypothetical protein AGMMS49941_13520 [Deferribacterales bacterium]